MARTPERREYIAAATAYLILGLILLHVTVATRSGNSAIFYALSVISIFFIWLGITSYMHVFFSKSETNSKRAGIAGLLLDRMARLFTR